VLHKLLLGLVLALSTAFPFAAAAQDRAGRVPTVDDLLNLKSVGSPQVSPDGKWVAYTVTATDWKQDAFVTHIWIAEVASGRTFQLTRGDKSCSGPKWSPDSTWLAFSSARVGDKGQIFAIRPDGGEAIQLTNAENGAGGYDWSPDGKQIAYTTSNVNDKDVKARKDYLGDFEVVRQEYAYQHLWTFAVADAMAAPASGKERTRGKNYSISSFAWSPDGTRIAFSAAINPDLIQGGTSDIYVLDLGTNTVKKIVDLAGPDNGPQWSPNGRSLVFSSAMGNPKYFHSNTRLAIVPADGGTPRSITDSLDEQPGLVAWKSDGVYFGASQKTASHLFRVDPVSAAITRISQPDVLMLAGGSLTADGKTVAFAAGSPTSLSEIYVSAVQPFAPRRLTSMTAQVAGYTLGRREVISWRSQDGTTIEGVLIKPANFEAGRKYPLLCIIHGGPTGVDRPTMIDARTYPADIWAARGALILKVNYRGSAGYGEKFRQLNVRNLGVGDAWDVLSGVDHLVKLGWVDPKRVGCMGWSQGGYISAFLTTSTKTFAAISVGAGISNWATYYYNTDITPFTIQYLGADPAADPDIYAKTSPMTYIKQASTPTLIQHCDQDRRVPIPNAYELRQGLQDRGVKVEMVVYKGFGHGVTKPKAARAVMQHNLAWFNHYIFGDPLPDFSAPELPKKTEPTPPTNETVR
jgi:dipeptidyl aminopeptidase/acylaminoacyl peptidase